MPFAHGKTTRLWVDQYELTAYFNELTFAAKAGTAETTVFGKGAKTFIGGLKEGTISGKGFFDAAAAQDPEFTNALGRSTNMNITAIPSGVTTAPTRCMVAFAAETDYQLSTPVNNVVATSFAAQADSGLSSGVMMYDPAAAAITTAATFGAPTNLTYSSGANTATVTASGSTASFLPAGVAIIAGATPGIFAYTGLSGSTFTGCTTLQAAVTPSGAISQGLQDNLPAATTDGLVMNVHVLTLTGTGGDGTLVPKLQHSSDGATWVDLIGGGGAYAFAQPTFHTTTAPAGPGATVGLVPSNIVINQYLRFVFTTTLVTTLSTTFFASVARQ